jgi:hypothetical protein
MCSNLADTSSWDGMAGVPPYKPGQAAGYSTQHQNEEWATTLRRRSTSKIRGRVGHCGTCQAKQSADFSLAGREALRFWAKNGAFEQSAKILIKKSSAFGQSAKILSKERCFWTKRQDFEQRAVLLDKAPRFWAKLIFWKAHFLKSVQYFYFVYDIICYESKRNVPAIAISSDFGKKAFIPREV